MSLTPKPMLRSDSDAPAETSPLRPARASVLLRVDCASSAALGVSYLTNLSNGGMFLHTEAELPVGTLLKLVIDFPEVVPPLMVDAEVRWSGTDLQSAAPGVGLAFRNVPSQSAARLAAIVERLASPGPLRDKPPRDVAAPMGKGVRVVLIASSEVLANVLRHRINRIGEERGWVVDLVLRNSLDGLKNALGERRARLFIVDQDSVGEASPFLNMIRADGRHSRAPVVVLGLASRTAGVQAQDTLYLRKPISMSPLMGIIGLVGGMHAAGST